MAIAANINRKIISVQVARGINLRVLHVDQMLVEETQKTALISAEIRETNRTGDLSSLALVPVIVVKKLNFTQDYWL